MDQAIATADEYTRLQRGDKLIAGEHGRCRDGQNRNLAFSSLSGPKLASLTSRGQCIVHQGLAPQVLHQGVVVETTMQDLEHKATVTNAIDIADQDTTCWPELLPWIVAAL